MKSIEKNHIWSRFSNWFLRHRKAILIIGGIIIFLAALAVTCVFFIFNTAGTKKEETPKTQIPKVVEPIKYYAPLSGRLTGSEALIIRPVTGMMIENSPEARPQSGLKNSGVVFEAIAEGGITRFLVLYQSETPQLIGPVRSVRMYYISWAAAFDASIGHVGGNMDALAEIRNGNYRDIDQFFNSEAYWRSEDRYAPHNMYTGFTQLDALNAEKGYTSSTFTGFKRIDAVPSATLTASNINVEISSYLFNSSYVYNTTTNTYDRFQAGEAHLDREDGQISPNCVIAMFVDEATIENGDGFVQSIGTVGTGRAVIFQNGVATEAIWAKSSDTSQITFKDSTGIDIPLVRGQTWITAVPNVDGSVTWN